MDNMLQKAAIVVAHPDDEILWFSSILDKVDRTIMCFLKCESRPDWSAGRIKSLKEYPLQNISCLRLDESEVFSDVHFSNPVVTQYGIKITDKQISDKTYKKNFYKLKKELKTRLLDCENVFTHNPWGEYGHEEHIQVYRVVRSLKEELGFTLWFSTYSSNKSFNLMLNHISNAKIEYVTLKTNKVLSERIEKIYKTNGCWTWYEDWRYFDEESFMKDDQLENGTYKFGHMFPLNLMNVEIFIESNENESKRKTDIFRLIISKILKKIEEKMILIKKEFYSKLKSKTGLLKII